MRHAWEPHELAYLAATTKVELPFRDRLAWGLQQRAVPPMRVAREWKRADLALLVDQAPAAIIESKALYSFDVVDEVTFSSYVRRIEYDAAKAGALAPGADRFGLVLVTHIVGRIPPHLKGIFKYSSGINKALERRSAGELLVSTRQAIEQRLGGSGRLHLVELEAGEYERIPVLLDVWLVDLGPQLAGTADATHEIAVGVHLEPGDVAHLLPDDDVWPSVRPAPHDDHLYHAWVIPFYMSVLGWAVDEHDDAHRALFAAAVADAAPWFCPGVARDLFSIGNWRAWATASFFMLVREDIEAVTPEAMRVLRSSWSYGLEMYLLTLASRDEADLLETVFSLYSEERRWVVAALAVGGERCRTLLSDLQRGGEAMDEDLRRRAEATMRFANFVRTAWRQKAAGAHYLCGCEVAR